jgi:hypothetical protein
MSDPNLSWLCPWCGGVASLPTAHAVICYSRTCACGAVALAAPPQDSDEIIDDAINIYGIPLESLTPFDADRLAALSQAGVAVRDGGAIDPQPPSPHPLRLLWFRR